MRSDSECREVPVLPGDSDLSRRLRQRQRQNDKGEKAFSPLPSVINARYMCALTGSGPFVEASSKLQNPF